MRSRTFTEPRTGVTFTPMLALVPQTLASLVIDVDEGGPEAADRMLVAFPGAWVFPSRRDGGRHVWLPIQVADKIGNAKFSAFGGAGEIRGGAGFLFLWGGVQMLDELRAKLTAVAVSYPVADVLAAFPKPQKANGKAASYKEGDRNNMLNRRVFEEVSAGRPEAVEAEKAAAVAAGLPVDEADRTVQSASAAGAAAAPWVFKRCDRRALERALAELEIDVRKDVRAAAYQFKPKGGSWANLEDETAEHLRALLSEKFRYQRNEGKPVPLQFSKTDYGRHSWRWRAKSLTGG